ncbi:MAG: phage integrase SAM-like domain-containing protein [Methanobrevibacter sp.]|nr:phage integrase SAM-like domain-containing protein [Methanobrevibacter sp.]
MKTSTAIIKLVLRINKVLSDGSHPIMLRVQFKGRKELSTGYSCLPRYWNEKQECVKKGYPNYAAINAAIGKKKMDVIARRDAYELNGVAYTPSMLLADEEVTVVKPSSLNELIKRHTSVLSPTTQKTWKSFHKDFLAYLNESDIDVVAIQLDTIKGYAKYLEDKKLSESTIKMTLAKVAAILKFAVEEGIIKESPFKRWNYGKKYKLKSNELYIDQNGINVLKEMLLERLVIRNGNMWHYIDGAESELIDRRNDLFVLAFYILGYTFQGLAPIDMCQLKVRDMEVEDVNGVNFYVWNIKRQKTKVAVKIMVSQKNFVGNVLIKTLLMFRKGEYLLPVLDGVENDRLKIYKKVSNWLSNHTDVLREWFKKANERIIQSNVDNHTNLQLINEKCTFYTYRSSFAMAFMQNGGNLLQLCTLLGRGVNVSLKSYVRQLKAKEDVAASVLMMD